MSIEEMNKIEIATKIQQAGGRLYLVGGALRDAMLGKEVHDEDYCVTGLTPEEEYPHHYGHEERGVALVEQLGYRLGIPNYWMKCGKIAAKEHMVAGKFAEMKANTKVSFIERIAKTMLGLEGLEIIAVCDRMGSSQKGVENIAFAEIGKKCLQEINGERVKEKYGITDGIALKSRLHEERVKWMKQQ